MINRRQRWMTGIRALVGVMLLLLNSLAATVLIAAAEPDFCSMECCVAEGHCCCAVRKPRVEGQKPGDEPIAAQLQIKPQCPFLTPPPSISGHLLLAILRAFAHTFGPAGKSPADYRTPTLLRHSLWLATISPRAPPSTL